MDKIKTPKRETFSKAIRKRRVGTTDKMTEVKKALLDDIFVLINEF